MATELLRIGQIKDRSSVSIKTIRYYESLGLIQSAQRTEGGFRLFEATTVQRLAFIKRSQTLGLSLTEIGEILQIHDQGEIPCASVTQKLEQKLQEIDQQIEQLRLLRSQLTSLLSHPPSPNRDVICPIIEQQERAILAAFVGERADHRADHRALSRNASASSRCRSDRMSSE